jgi:hypothetical protein
LTGSQPPAGNPWATIWLLAKSRHKGLSFGTLGVAIGLFLVKNDGVFGLRAAIVPVALPGFEKCENTYQFFTLW